MRNRSGEILRRVEAGESIQVSNNGRPAAVIIPIGGTVLDGLVARGEARPARESTASLLTITRAKTDITSARLIEDSRGAW
jgi:antitoxin (DNA-binding transcriptional repressor) of toxin-antitoxin stability system